MLASEIPISRASSRPQCDHDGDGTDECASVRDRLAMAKDRVPSVQSQIGMKRWNSIVNVASSIERSNRNRVVINRAYHKMHEISMSCVLPLVTSSVHLCEAPGGFVQCVAHHLRGGEWSWRAVTLRDGVSVDETRLPKDCGRFLFADVLCEEPRIATELGGVFPDGVDLVTADGAVEMNHDRMEEEHLPLARAQARVALTCLKPGGTFVLKVFECLRPSTRDFIAQLTRCFETVSLIKPTSSRRTNSERYLVCRVFDGTSRTIDEGEYVHALAWREEYESIVCGLATDQTRALTQIFESVS